MWPMRYLIFCFFTWLSNIWQSWSPSLLWVTFFTCLTGTHIFLKFSMKLESSSWSCFYGEKKIWKGMDIWFLLLPLLKSEWPRAQSLNLLSILSITVGILMVMASDSFYKLIISEIICPFHTSTQTLDSYCQLPMQCFYFNIQKGSQNS